MQTTIYPKYKIKNLTAQCSKEHLEKTHGYKIVNKYEIINQIRTLMRNQRRESREGYKIIMLTRKDRIALAKASFNPI